MYVGGGRQIFNKFPTNNKIITRGTGYNREVSYKPEKKDIEINTEKNELTPLQQGEKKSTNSWKFFSLDVKNSFNFTKSPEALPDKHIQELTEKVKELENELKKTISEKDSIINEKDLKIVKLTSHLKNVASIHEEFGNSPTTKTDQIISGTKDAAKFAAQSVASSAVTSLAYGVALFALAYYFGVNYGKAEEKAEEVRSGKVSDVDLKAHEEKLESYADVAIKKMEKLNAELDKIGQLEKVMVEYPKDKDLQDKRIELHNVSQSVDKNINSLTKKYKEAIIECKNEKIEFNKNLNKNSEKADKLNFEYERAVKYEMKKLDLPKDKAAFSILALMKKNSWADYNTFSKQLNSEAQTEIKKMFEELDKIKPAGNKNLEKSENLFEQLQEKIDAVRPNSGQAVNSENNGLGASIRYLLGIE